MNLREETIKVLRPFRDVVENDIGDDEADVDTFIPMSRQYARARILTVGDLRAAAALLSRLCATCADAPAVDTSAEKLLALADRVRRHLNLQGDSLTTLLRDCEAALRSLAAHPAEPAGMELETTAEARRYWTEEGPPFLNVAHEDRAMLARDFDRMRARAEKAEAATVIERERAEIAEKGRREAKTQLRDAQARGKGVEEALDRAAKRVRNQRDRVRDIAGTMELGLTRTQLEGVSGELDHLGMDCARAALSRPEAWTPTHRHANGGLYRLLPVEFHWEPEWDKPAALYENEKGVKIGRFADVFAERFTPLSRPEGSAT